MNLQKFETEIRKRARAENGCLRPIPIVGPCDFDGEVVLESSCKPEKISSIFSSFDLEKANILKSIGFDGLLKIPFIENLNDDLTLWLYQRFDLATMCLHLDSGVDLFLTDADVFLIFGIPFDGCPVNFGLNQSSETVRAFHEKLLNNTTSGIINMDVLEGILKKDYGPSMSSAEIDAFIMASVLISMHYLLAPEQKASFPSHLIKNFVGDVNPNQINWAQYVLWTIGRSAFDTRLQITSGKKNISMFGCAHLLQVFYLDNLNFGPCTPYHIVLPRASAYSSALMNQLIVSASSGFSDNKLIVFGTKQVRPSTDVCYTRGWQQHVQTHRELENISEDDFLSSIALLSEGINLIDIFGPQLYGFNGSTFVIPMELLPGYQNSYLKFKTTLNEKIPSLLSKAALIVKNRIVTSYPQHIPKDIFTTLSEVTPIGEMHHDSSSIVHGHTSTPNSQTSSSMVKVVTKHSNFEICPFGTSFKHEDVSFTNKARCYLWLTNTCLPREELNLNWILFTTPKEIVIPGAVVKNSLKANGIFDISIVDAIMNVWNYLDGILYKDSKTNNRWRHFLPASFAEMVLRNSDYLNCNATRANFIGQHINYNVEDCQQIIVPVCDNRKSWSTYIWDFKHKTITVFDPMLINSPPRRVKAKHDSPVFKLHNALLACSKNFFSGWHIDEIGWKDFYLTGVGDKCKMQDSGLYAVHYARALCGEKLIFPLLDESLVCQARGEILYHMFKCEDNKGYKPESIMQDI